MRRVPRIYSIAPTVNPAMNRSTASKTLDLDTASEAELKALPGTGDAYEKKIVDNRPYERKDKIAIQPRIRRSMSSMRT